MNDIVEQKFCEVLHRICIAAEDEDRYVSNGGDNLEVTGDGVPIRKLFISNLAERTTYKNLFDLFSKYGNIESCYLRRNQGKSNYAFVTFSNVMDAMKAREEGSRKEIRLHNRDLRVLPADSWHQPDNIENQYYNHAKEIQKAESKLSNRDYFQDYLSSDNTAVSIHTLNDDCLTHIFLYLPIVHRVRIERVCKRWKAVSQESWRTVRRLDLSHSTWGFSPTSKRTQIDIVTLRKVLLRCGRFLNEINLSHLSHSLTQSTLTVVSKLCPNLQTIDVTALMVSASGIGSLTANCHDIVSLSIGCSAHACDTDLSRLFHANPKLRQLRLIASRISGSCLLFLPPSTVEEIVLERCLQIKWFNLSYAIAGLENLRSLSIRNCMMYMPGTVMEAIGTHSRTLKKLEISGNFITISPSDMLHIGQLTNLETLHLGMNSAVTNELLVQLTSKCLQLKNLEISGCCLVKSEDLATITTLPKLETLKINYVGPISVDGIQEMPNLRQLECRKCLLTDERATFLIKSAPRLELLDLSGCCNITNQTLENAVVITNARTNNVVLKIYVGGTKVQLNTFHDVSPFLQIVNVNLSIGQDPQSLFDTFGGTGEI